MPRTIGENIRNKLIIKDRYNESSFITVYHGSADASERIAYRASLWKREGDTLKSCVTETRQEWGEKKITGFKEGDFRFKEGETLREISSDPESANYEPNWKALLRKYAPDILEAVAEQIFETTIVIAGQEYTQKN